MTPTPNKTIDEICDEFCEGSGTPTYIRQTIQAYADQEVAKALASQHMPGWIDGLRRILNELIEWKKEVVLAGVPWGWVDLRDRITTTLKLVDSSSDSGAGWIPVSSPPKEGGRYWCYCEEVGCLGTSYFQWNCSYNPSDGCFSDNCNYIKVTHWMPLPTAPTT